MRAGQGRARRAAPLVVALLVVAAAWLLVPSPPGSAPVDDARAPVAPPSDRAPIELIAAEAPASARSAAETPEIPAATASPVPVVVRSLGSVGSAVQRVDFGQLRVRAVDAATRAPLDHVRVRAASDARIADRDASASEVVLRLTPGTYTPLVLVPGYEPVELAPVRVDSGADVELTAELRRSNASITGEVIGSGVASHAELTGAGRRPCERCAESGSSRWSRREPCNHCGFAADFTRVPVGLSATFAFTGLSGGNYALRLTDEHGHSDGPPLLVVLAAGEHVHVRLPAPLLRDVLVDVIDVDQVSLAAAWGARVRAVEADAQLSSFADTVFPDLVWRFGVLDGTEVFGSGDFSTPAPPRITIGRSAAFGGRKLGTRVVDDHPRRPGQELRPPAASAQFPAVVIESVVGAEGLVRIQGLPAHELSIRLTCEPFAATVAVPESFETITVRAQLERTSERRVSDDTDPATFRALDAARFR